MRIRLRWLALGLCAAPLVAMGGTAPQVVLATPGSAGSNGGAIERFTMRFSEAMVPLGDPRAAPPAKLTCPVGANGRWVDPQTFVYDFEKALPGGLTCKVDLNDGLASSRGAQLKGARNFTIDTGGPSARGVLSGNDSNIEEQQVFLVATNVAPTAALLDVSSASTSPSARRSRRAGNAPGSTRRLAATPSATRMSALPRRSRWRSPRRSS